LNEKDNTEMLNTLFFWAMVELAAFFVLLVGSNPASRISFINSLDLVGLAFENIEMIEFQDCSDRGEICRMVLRTFSAYARFPTTKKG